ncbi:MAG: ABC transporter substrate-binding protein [Treponema sp.]|jgi:putative aldouronate transport system substrate-binding protein|nr:ABC transporter substrate-binding protein [Treponema sp.]
MNRSPKRGNILLVFAVLAVMGLVCGCGGGNKGTSAGGPANFDEPPYEINFLYLVASEGANQGKVQEAVNALALKELNMKVKLIPMTFGAFFSQVPMMLAANEPLDLFPAMSYNFSTFIDAQYVVNMADYLDYAQDAIRILGDDAFTGYIGDFLIGFGQMKERAFPAGLVVRRDIFEELGYKVEDFSVTTDDYNSFNQITALFAKVKQKYPSMSCIDGTSIMGMQEMSYMDNLGSNFGVLENYGQTTTITNWYESEQYKRFCLIAREWFQKGYSSGDIAVNRDSGEIKMRAGNSFSFIANVKPNTDIEKLAQTSYETLVIPLGKVMKTTNAVNAGLYVIANASKNPAKAMQFLNWTFISGEFTDLINWGIKGEDWVETPDGMAAYPEGINAQNVGYHNDFGWIYPNQFVGHPWVGNPPDIWDQYRKYNAGLLVSKAFGFTFDSTPVANEEAQLYSVQEEYRYDLSFGAVEIENRLREFNKALYDAGLQRVMDEKQRQLNEWLAKK